MAKRTCRVIIYSLLMAALGVVFNRATWVYAQDPDGRDATIAIITSPVEGAQVSGQVLITGSAGHPTQFVGYELEFDNLTDPNEIWLPIGQRVAQQVTNGTLQIWDTIAAQVSDGPYQIRLRVFLANPDEPPVEFVVTRLNVVNTLPTPLPTIRSDAATPTSGPPPTAGPSPTPLISQPPTTTPRPTIETLIDPSPQSTSGTAAGETSLNVNRLQGAFCTGAFVTAGFFLLFAGYLWLRGRLRPYTRQIMWQIRSEMDNDRMG